MFPCSFYSKPFIVFLFICYENLSVDSVNTTKTNHLVTYKGFMEVLRALDLLNEYPEILDSTHCYIIDGIAVTQNSNKRLSITITINMNESKTMSDKFCSENQFKKSSIVSSNATILENDNKNRSSILGISQTIGIIICATLLGIFFFIAGIMRLKNFLRRNNNSFKLNGLRSCLTDDNGQKWRTANTQPTLHQSTISNYLQLQSVIDKNVSQFMIRSNNYSKSADQENKRSNSSIKRKLSIKNKLLPKRLNNNQTTQRRYSLTNEIESVMNKHFNMIGVSRKYDSKSTQNIGGPTMPQNNRFSQHSMLNELNLNYNQRDLNANHVTDASSMSTKSLLSRYQRCGNFPGRRATTIGGRSNNSRQKLGLRCVEKDSPSANTIYSSHHSVIVSRASRHPPFLKKQLTLQEGNENQVYKYLLNNTILYPTITNTAFDESDNEPSHLKVPFKSLNLLPNKKCIFNINDEKTSPSQESRESNSRCSSFDKASSTWSSLEVPEELESKNKN